jgi:hypothetical protein
MAAASAVAAQPYHSMRSLATPSRRTRPSSRMPTAMLPSTAMFSQMSNLGAAAAVVSFLTPRLGACSQAPMVEV